MLAGAAALAGDVKFGGEIDAGYALTFSDGDLTTHSWYDDDPGDGEVDLSFADEDGLWKVTVKGQGDNTKLYGDLNFTGSATVFLDKALKAAGVDLGGLSLSYTIGSDIGNQQSLYAYGDASGKHLQRFRASGANEMVFDAGYEFDFGKVSARLATSPIPATNGEGTIVASVLANLNVGVKVAAGYGHDVRLYNSGADTAVLDAAYAQASVDVAKLAKLDGYKLAVEGFGTFAFDNDDNPAAYNDSYGFGVTVKGGVDVVDGYVEYAYVPDAKFKVATEDADDDDNDSYLKIGANVNVVEGLSIGPWFEIPVLSENYYNFGVDFGYEFGKVAYNFEVEYDILDGDNEENALILRPYITIGF